MYVELRITAEYGDKPGFIARLVHEIGVNLITAEAAVAQTVFQPAAHTVVPMVIAAEQIPTKGVSVYFLEGSDTIVVHVSARTIGETKQQAVRIARRTPTLFEAPSVKTKINAVIYVVEAQGLDTPIIAGNHIGFRRRFVDAFTERWLTRIVTPGIVFGVAAVRYLPGNSVFQSALIAFAAAAGTLLIEGVVFALTAGDWKWKEIKNDE